MTFTFDERGEASIKRLRELDPTFSEPLYRQLGPVQYWMKHREQHELLDEALRAKATTPVVRMPMREIAPERERCCARIPGKPDQRCIERKGHQLVADPNGNWWSHVTRLDTDREMYWKKSEMTESNSILPVEPVPARKGRKEDKKPGPGVELATKITLGGCAAIMVCVCAFFVAVICFSIWNMFFA